MKRVITKSMILENIFEAKNEHKKWVKKADHLVNGMHSFRGDKIEVKADNRFVSRTTEDCMYGILFKSIRINLDAIKETKYTLNRLDNIHINIHKEYEKIYKIYFEKKEKKLFQLLIPNKGKISKEKKEEASNYFKTIKESSKEMLLLLNELEIKVKGIDQSKLNPL